MSIEIIQLKDSNIIHASFLTTVFYLLINVKSLSKLMIDASYGFEMEIFEFIHIAQVHGLPRVMGVVSHLDCIPRELIFNRHLKDTT